jgi:hypothetical protein
MKEDSHTGFSIEDIAALPLPELRGKWSEYWNYEPHPGISRALLEKSLEYKIREARGEGLTAEQRARIGQLISAYKKNPGFLTEDQPLLKPGTRLIRYWKREKHVVTVLADGGFEHGGKRYTSLSTIARSIAGTRWNGWVFFGLKKKRDRKS